MRKVMLVSIFVSWFVGSVAVNQSYTGNEANAILNEMKLDFILSCKNNGKRPVRWWVRFFAFYGGNESQ